MGCISRIKNCNDFTETEQKIADYILENRNQIIRETAQSLADITETSPAAVIRVSKKLNYKGFTELKLDLAADSEITDDLEFSETIRQTDTLQLMAKKLHVSNEEVIKQTYQMLNVDDLEKASSYLKKAEKIYLFGIGASGICCQDFYQKLTRINKPVIFCQDFHQQLAAATFVTSKDAAIAISYSGETREVILAAKYVKECRCPLVVITSSQKAKLSKLGDVGFYLPMIENDLRLGAISSRNATLSVTDLLYLSIIKDDLDNYKKKLKKTREMVRKMRADKI